VLAQVPAICIVSKGDSDLMIGELSKGAGYFLIGVYLLVLSAFLVLAFQQSIGLVGLHHASSSLPLARSLSSQWWAGIGFGSYALGMVIMAAVLFTLVFRHPRRLLSVSLIVALVSAGLNLYSARHALPQVLIWPGPRSLSDQYIRALAADDLEAALRLTDGSDACTSIMVQAFQEDQARLKQRLGAGWQGAGLSETSIRSIATFFGSRLPEGFSVLQPVPQQLARIIVESENGKTAWLSLRMSHGPFLGRRYICGRGMDPL
jgi:hypothetical protein